LVSTKMPQLVSLNRFQNAHSSATDSSFAIAADGGGLYQSETATVLTTDETAGFVIWSAEWNRWLSSSIGLRYDHSAEYGATTNPRLALIVRPTGSWYCKLMYGSAFRQPTVFELTDEFRHNPNLEPEQIDTYEIENGVRATSNINIRFNLFYSKLSNFITVVPDPSRPGNERYDNVGTTWIRGATATVDFQPTSGFYLFANYTFTDGKEPGTDWQAIDHVARHKANLGLNWQLLDKHLELNFRVNHVGEAQAPESNVWMQLHEAGTAPGYTIANLSVAAPRWLVRFRLVPQLVVKNLFNENYYGLGRQSGSSNIADYDPASNPNPAGFIPPYHPQPGREFLVNLTYTWSD
jgi:outer membrane receptor for ferrienterochelin and colicins